MFQSIYTDQWSWGGGQKLTIDASRDALVDLWHTRTRRKHWLHNRDADADPACYGSRGDALSRRVLSLLRCCVWISTSSGLTSARLTYSICPYIPSREDLDVRADAEANHPCSGDSVLALLRPCHRTRSWRP